MVDISRHPNLLRALAAMDRAKAFVQRRERGHHKADMNLRAFYAQAWTAAAEKVGGTVEDLGHGVLDIRIGDDFHTRVIGNTTDIDGLVTHLAVRTKPVSNRLLSRHGLPQPKYLPFTVHEMGPAIEFMESIGGPCVVKPAEGTGGGIGITTNVRTRYQLARAAWAAARFGSELTVEQQIEGDNYRLLFLDGKLLDAVLRLPPSVTGDGSSTILTLVKNENARRVERGMEVSHTMLSVDMDMRRTLERQNLSFTTVPSKGQAVQVKTAINENSANDNVTVTDRLSPATIADAALAAKVCGVRLAGVDLILKDPAVPMREGGGVILEVNSPPGYFWHYRKRDGAFPLADVVLKQLIADRARADASDPHFNDANGSHYKSLRRHNEDVHV